MKICYLTHTMTPRTGIGEFTINLINGVKRTIPNVDFSMMTGEDFLKPNLFHILLHWVSIRKKIKESEIVHALDAYPYGVIACLTNIFINKPIIITAIGSGSLQLLWKRGWSSYILRWAYKSATCVTAISHYVSDEIKKEIPGLTIEVINPGVQYDFWSHAEVSPKDSTFEKLKPYIISVGEFKKRKGYSEMLPIIREVVKKNPNSCYIIIGNINKNKKYLGELEKLIFDLDIKDNVKILSGLSAEELRSAYSHATAYFTLPKNVEGDIEGFGMSIVEAAAAGTPAVVGKGSGADDAVLDGKSGFLVSSDDSEELVRKLEVLIRDRAVYNQMSLGAQQFAKNMIWENQIKKYIILYQKNK
jgi:phosphatidyl-myo-inositol dimannoside synthase